ncbi:hypothetical protein JYU34_001139 [Plutella xylostella]|uniref:Serine/threonine-protein kinase receptor n=1 Tax=Plutella xylostella TaxID=51655 RepID=A0ABQ7R635_PLUXY|nr:hypothetical protein JYU34_001139 [Plutella xylostella]
MEEIIAHRVTPIIKCMVLFLLIFTAKVLTSRPHEGQDEARNSIHHGSNKPAHYVRTFTKYHHRRTIQYGQETDWPLTQDHPKVIQKRSVDIPNSSDFLGNAGIPIMNQFAPDVGKDNIIGPIDKNPVMSKESVGSKNGLGGESKKFKMKAAAVIKEPTTTVGPSITCLYKIHSVALSITPSYDEDSNAQQVVENDHFDSPGVISTVRLRSGVEAAVERCTHPVTSCYTLWHRGADGNMTVLGQGCWKASQARRCDKCTRVAPMLPGTFCCCNHDYCNADFSTYKEEPAQSYSPPNSVVSATQPPLGYAALAAALAAAAALALALAAYCRRCGRRGKQGQDLEEKGEVMGTGPDALATGLSCVDNLTLIEHIGQGKFGTVWRGSLGSTPVAVKLYANMSTWQKERAIYSMPHLAHPNILKYYGSDSRPTLLGSAASHLLVLQLCRSTLRSRLREAPLSLRQFAHYARGLAAALAALHASTPTKPCIVHRDVNSNNVLISLCGRAILADLGLAAPVTSQQNNQLTEAGTLRYLSPEALEGALDLSGAPAALCAVDVYALGLTLWEMLWRTVGAHAGPVPPHQLPYQQHHVTTLKQMQNLVCRKKARPPLPRPESRAVRVAADTCRECWDHDAEARLTAVCVEERMSELTQMLQAQGPRIHDNNLHPHTDANPPPPETEKNSNLTVSQNCDVTTPLLYTQPHIGRNPCLERNTDTHTQTTTVELIHKSLKDITVPNVEGPRVQNVQNIDENCLSVARVSNHRVLVNENSDRMNEIRSYQRPLDYVPNDVSVHDENRALKETNIHADVKIEKPKWGIRRFLEKTLSRNPKPLETEVKLVQENLSNGSLDSGRIRTSIVSDKQTNLPFNRPSNIVLNMDGRNFYNMEAPCLSPPNRTLSPTMIMESEMNRENKVFGFKEMPQRTGENADRPPNQQLFAVIVPKGQPGDYKRTGNLMEMKKTGGSSESLNKTSVRTSMSAQSIFATAGQSESEDSTIKKRLSCDNKIISNASNSGRSSRASINLELQFLDNQNEHFDSPFDLNSDCSSSEDEHLMLLSENGGSKITMQAVPKTQDTDKRKNNVVLKEATQTKTDFVFNKFQNKYTNFDNEFSDPNDKENLATTYSGDNPVYLAALNGEIDTTELKYLATPSKSEPEERKSPKPCLKNLAIKRQHSLEHVSELFSSSGDIHLQNPAGRVKTPGDIPVAVRKARRDRALQKGRASESNRLSLYDDRMMFGNSL